MSRRAVAPSFRSFGRRRRPLTADGFRAQDGSGEDALRVSAREGSDQLPDDVRLFALTFAGGFLFMTVFLG